MGSTAWKQLSNPFYDAGSNDKGIGIQLAYSLARVGLGFTLAALVAIPLGFVIGSRRSSIARSNPFIQVLKPISPLAWMPLALYTIKDSATSSIFVIFICSLWPMLINTAHGVASVRRDWLERREDPRGRHVAHLVRGDPPRRGAVILTGMRISMGIAWLVIVAAEMLVGNLGIGYFVWNEWNNLSLPT
jgi:nitrate/nitrite transport system permease protein